MKLLIMKCVLAIKARKTQTLYLVEMEMYSVKYLRALFSLLCLPKHCSETCLIYEVVGLKIRSV